MNEDHENNMKFHPQSNTYILRKKSYFEQNVSLDGNLITGPDTNFWKDLKVAGNVELGKGTVVRGSLHAEEVILGPDCRVDGDIHASRNATLLDRCTISGQATTDGWMKVRPGCNLKFVRAKKELELVGKVNVKSIESGTKVIVHSE
ncbi:bactofilin family protein [Methanohalophilus sp.]